MPHHGKGYCVGVIFVMTGEELPLRRENFTLSPTLRPWSSFFSATGKLIVMAGQFKDLIGPCDSLTVPDCVSRASIAPVPSALCAVESELLDWDIPICFIGICCIWLEDMPCMPAAIAGEASVVRSEERRVGKECVSTCRSRGSAE